MRGALIGLALLATTCGPGGGSTKERAPAKPEAPPRALLPERGGVDLPSLADLAGQGGTTLADVDTCGGCHQEVFAQQQASAHAYSSFNNPIYRISVDRTRAEVNKKASKMCAGCHDISLMADGIMDREVEPEDARAHAGVTCRVCHGIVEATRDGNGSYTLKREPFVLPKEGDAASVEAHKASVKPLRTAEMCGSCHKTFLDDQTGNHGVFLAGQDDFTPWSGSPYNKSGLARIDDKIEKQDCIACHMPSEVATRPDPAAKGGRIKSHRFPGGHTWLAQMLGEEQQLAVQQEFLAGSVSIDLAELRRPAGERHLPAEGAPMIAGEEVSLDVVVRNLRTGHRFPGGVLDAQDTWIQLEVVDARGARVAAAGVEHARTGDDPTAHVFRALVADANADLRFVREVHTFRAPVVNHTIAPRDAIAARYRWKVPAGVKAPLVVTARVVHRSRNLRLQREACAASRAERGRRFAAKARELDDPVLDPCAPQPLTVLAEARAQLGGAIAAPEVPGGWKRRFEHGMALLHGLQEHLEDARLPLMRALEQVERDPAAGPRERAMVLIQLGRLEGLQGRTAEAVEWLDRAQALLPDAPAIAFARGTAFARVWRWREAADALQLAAPSAPDNPTGWAELAMALGSLGLEKDALAAAQHGLALSPRDADCLRVQALAVRALGASDPDAASALDAYDRFRPPDRATDLRIACTAKDPLCARERDPIHVHDLLAPPTKHALR
ncbi:MAG TPA: multiheme c-type cytochrome [Kofleriaceae bacterium]|nr:multiheme c-type cytochrome [Kofleriaceae bacterium]